MALFDDVSPPRGGGPSPERADERDTRRSARRWRDAAALAACAALWLALRPYYGFKHDALIYMGRGLADLDPGGVGRDIMFQFDGQSKFSVFSHIVDALLAPLGLGAAAKLLAASGLALWFAALVALARRLAEGVALAGLMLLVACCDGAYGDSGVFHFAESFATPRPFAEAFVLAGLAARLAERRGVAWTLLALAAVLHPIMAAPGAVVALLLECARDQRWRSALHVVAALAAAVIVAGALLDPPFAPLDAQWMEIVRRRCPYLFVSDWPVAAFAAIVRQFAALALGAALVPEPARRLFVCAIAAAVIGLAASLLLGDALHLRLAVQAQGWRALWLAAALAPLALGVATPALWRAGAQGRIVLALAAAGWMLRDAPESAALSLLAPIAWRWRARWADVSPRLFERLAWALCGVAGAATSGASLWFARSYLVDAPPGQAAVSAMLAAGAPLFVPVFAAGLALLVGAMRPKTSHFGGAAIVLSALAAFSWSDEAPYDRAIASTVHPPELEAIVSARAGEVLWINDNAAPWAWLGRANWAARVQGAGVVFSRPLAFAWRARMDALREIGWVFDTASTPSVESMVDFPSFDRPSLERLCGRADAPAWIVGAVERPAAPAGLDARIWSGPRHYFLRMTAEGLNWSPIEHYAILDCAAYRPLAAPRG